ncbi:phosphoenolpyruvate--protein phosphotransferase [Desulfurispirillum indicum]|uniref:phosphoenolpyruvate--protein phosphotransferase n=1 Tax=Desulfurispirillum indicum TaxID=936456 RepID=UPI001CFB820F|nr:phosphoenolpyruvate--protein phosphotransferase [Desulfurispirillum indicum]UCZ55942.1 phosphoenolpyruvate--protein phosphotransferase [Desulfurispirillum indicum]
METYYGHSVSSGIALGRLVRLHETENRIKSIYIASADQQGEWQRFEQARHLARAELQHSAEVISDLLGEAQRLIIEPQIMMLDDNSFVTSVRQSIFQESYSLEYAVEKFRQEVSASFASVEDTYLRERMNDIFTVTRLVVKYAQQQNSNPKEPEDFSYGSEIQGAIVYANDITPSEITLLISSGIVGAVTAKTSALSHTAILCKSMEIPMLTGIEFGEVQDCPVIVDSYRGQFIVNPTPEVEDDFRQRQLRIIQYKTIMVSSSFQRKDTDVQIYGNVEIPAEAIHLAQYQAHGIGLLRSEFMILQMERFPRFEEQLAFYQSILEKCNYLPTTVRTVDIGSDKVASFLHMEHEDNPAMGRRGIRYSLSRPEEFATHLRAILSLAQWTDLRVMFPMVTIPDEVIRARALTEQVLAELRRENPALPASVPIGIMVETPASAMSIGAFVKYIDFISVGTNDLTQYVMASDRTSKGVGHLCNPYHPPILRVLHHIAQTSKKFNIPVNICGETASDIFYLPILHGMGYRSFSVRTPSIPEVRVVLSDLDPARSEHLATRVMESWNVEQVTEQCVEFIQDILPTELLEYVMVNKTC